MIWLTAAYTAGLSVFLLCVSVMVATLIMVGGAIYAWTRRPEKKDEYLEFVIHERLADIAHHPLPHSGSSARA
jgi:hypothetical protein